MHAICIGKCTPVQMNTIFDVCSVIVGLCLYWYVAVLMLFVRCIYIFSIPALFA